MACVSVVIGNPQARLFRYRVTVASAPIPPSPFFGQFSPEGSPSSPCYFCRSFCRMFDNKKYSVLQNGKYLGKMIWNLPGNFRALQAAVMAMTAEIAKIISVL